MEVAESELCGRKAAAINPSSRVPEQGGVGGVRIGMLVSRREEEPCVEVLTIPNQPAIKGRTDNPPKRGAQGPP